MQLKEFAFVSKSTACLLPNFFCLKATGWAAPTNYVVFSCVNVANVFTLLQLNT